MQTLRELELEQKVAALERRILQLTYDKGLPAFGREIFQPKAAPVKTVSGDLGERFTRVIDATCAFVPKGGWEVRLAAYPNKEEQQFRYSYYVTDPWDLSFQDIRYVMDQEHQRFQMCLIDHAIGKKMRTGT